MMMTQTYHPQYHPHITPDVTQLGGVQNTNDHTTSDQITSWGYQHALSKYQLKIHNTITNSLIRGQML